VEGTLHVLEGRLNNAVAGSEALAPAEIREEKIAVASHAVTARLPRRSVGVVEIPFLPAGPAR
jgi:hypothetical protein